MLYPGPAQAYLFCLLKGACAPCTRPFLASCCHGLQDGRPCLAKKPESPNPVPSSKSLVGGIWRYLGRTAPKLLGPKLLWAGRIRGYIQRVSLYIGHHVRRQAWPRGPVGPRPPRHMFDPGSRGWARANGWALGQGLGLGPRCFHTARWSEAKVSSTPIASPLLP